MCRLCADDLDHLRPEQRFEAQLMRSAGEALGSVSLVREIRACRALILSSDSEPEREAARVAIGLKVAELQGPAESNRQPSLQMGTPTERNIADLGQQDAQRPGRPLRELRPEYCVSCDREQGRVLSGTWCCGRSCRQALRRDRRLRRRFRCVGQMLG
jgi:hypothetical protein